MRAVRCATTACEAPAPSMVINSRRRCSAGYLADRLVDDGDVIGGGVAAGVAGPQRDRQRLFRVVTPCRQRMKAIRLLERRGGADLLGVRNHDRGVQPDHHRVTQIAVTGDRRGDAAVPCFDQLPHPTARFRPPPPDAFQRLGVDLVQRPPRGRHRGDRAEQLALITQHRDVTDRASAVGQHDGDVGQHPAPVMHRDEPGPGQRLGQLRRQTGPVTDQTRQRRAGMRHHATARRAE